MEDVTPGLLEAIKEEFDNALAFNEKLQDIAAKIVEGTATYLDANEYALEVGDILAKAFQNNLSSAVLPDGKMYYNIAQRILGDTLGNEYKLIADVAQAIQQSLNEAAGIGIKAIRPELNKDRIEGIVNRVSSADKYDDVSWVLDEPIKNFSQSIIDDSIKVNSEFHGKSGLSPKIVRRVSGNCCKWCLSLAGTYKYPDVPKDVYRRHERCRCTVDYDPGSGKVQNVHTKKWYSDEEAVEYRKKVRIVEAENIKLSKGRDVTEEYLREKYPGKGKITADEGYVISLHKNEIKTAQWLVNNLGGDIVLLNEASIEGIKRPDYMWRGKLWDLKNTTTEKAANSALRKGIKQIRNNPGGVILDYASTTNHEELIKIIESRVKSSKNDIGLDVMIIENEKLYKVIRY